MEDGSCLAFIEQPGQPFEFKPQHDYDLHIALEVDRPVLDAMFKTGKEAGIETRGIIDHLLGLFPRSERLCRRIDGQAAGLRQAHGTHPQRRAANAC
jgi:hypothetical protein